MKFRIFYLSIAICSLTFYETLATHIRAADLTGVRTSKTQLTYRFKLTLYRDTQGIPVKSDGIFTFGIDGEDITNVSPVLIAVIPNAETEVYEYMVEYTFPSPGNYSVGYFERNRNENIANMDVSGQTPFYIESTFRVDPVLGCNSSPVLTISPIDMGAIGQKFIHNPGAFDPEGDSLAYKLTIPRQNEGQNVVNYRSLETSEFSTSDELGNTPPTFAIDPITGDLTWDAPTQPGEYNVAFFVCEYRNGIEIGRINRDMQITIKDHDNDRPRVTVPQDTCVIAGNSITGIITANDGNNNQIILTEENQGGIFSLPPPRNSANFIQTQNVPGVASGFFSWLTTCQDARRESYQVVFKAEDRPIPSSNRLVDVGAWHIRVVGPPPNLTQANPNASQRTITLNWDTYQCQNAQSIKILRRVGNFDFTPNVCQTGLPPEAGYEQVGMVDISENSFVDRTARRGVTYCYRIYAIFPEPSGGESIASQEQCTFLPTIAPYMTKVDVLDTDLTQGRIAVEWTKLSSQTVGFPKPITYQLRRYSGLQGGAATVIASFQEEDTTYIDTGLNTEERPYRYDLIIFSENNPIDTSATASSVYLRGTAADNVSLTWQADVPWSNQSTDHPYHYIFREASPGDGTLVLIDSVAVTANGLTYLDDGGISGFPLIQRQTYCYQVATVGTYNNIAIREPLVNNSQVTCVFVSDTVPPCSPFLSVDNTNGQCTQAFIESRRSQIQVGDFSCSINSFSNNLSWADDNDANCDADIASYSIYYAPKRNGSYELIAQNLTSTSFVHDNLSSLAGCYFITAVDSSDNESDASNIICVENCPEFYMPNVFTPNSDGRNDLLKPICRLFVENVDFTILNRWGEVVYASTDNLDINWDGKNSSGGDVPDGVYYYAAVVTYNVLDEENNTATLRGVIHLLR